MDWIIKVLLFLALVVPAQANEADAISEVLDSLHKHAAQANGEAYFALYADDAVFIGTDARETWSLDEFKRYATPYFNKGTGWVYHSVERRVSFSKTGNVAWFVEILDSESYGVTRGTGVLQKYDGAWLIEQYHLTLPVPNSVIDQVAEDIKASEQ